MAFKVAHSENYDLRKEMNELLHYRQKKILYVKTKSPREKPKHLGHFVSLLLIKVKKF